MNLRNITITEEALQRLNLVNINLSSVARLSVITSQPLHLLIQGLNFLICKVDTHESSHFLVLLMKNKCVNTWKCPRICTEYGQSLLNIS